MRKTRSWTSILYKRAFSARRLRTRYSLTYFCICVAPFNALEESLEEVRQVVDDGSWSGVGGGGGIIYMYIGNTAMSEVTS